MRNRLDEYIKLLNEFYDEKFLFNGIKGNYEGILDLNNSIIGLNEPHKINEAIIKYRRALGEGCKNCEKIFESKKHSKINFYDRPMEFPSFYKSLDFNNNKDHIKDIMIIGEAAGPTIATHINCTYGLSNTKIDDDGRIKTKEIFNKLKEYSPKLGESLDLLKVGKNQTKLKGLNLDDQIKKFRNNLHNNLWERLKKILPISLEALKSKVYVTDLVKCNARGNSIWNHLKEKCFENFLIHEIRIINPKLIIFLGNSGYYYLKERFEFDECCPTDNNCALKKRPEYAKYKIYNFRDDKYLKIYYDKDKSKEINFNNKPFSEFTQEDRKKLIKKHNIPRTFPTFGTVIFKHDSISRPIKFIKIFHNSKRNDPLWKDYTDDYKDLIISLVEDKVITL